MAEIELDEVSAVLRITGVDQYWAVKSQLEIPFSHIINAEVATGQWRRRWKGSVLFGTTGPSLTIKDSVYKQGQWVFWHVQDPSQAITIYLTNNYYSGVVVQTEDRPATVAKINRAIANLNRAKDLGH